MYLDASFIKRIKKVKEKHKHKEETLCWQIAFTIWDTGQ